jgi:hypothetical protein
MWQYEPEVLIWYLWNKKKKKEFSLVIGVPYCYYCCEINNEEEERKITRERGRERGGKSHRQREIERLEKESNIRIRERFKWDKKKGIA